MTRTTNALAVLGVALMDWDHGIEDILLAIRAADTVAKDSGRPVYIMPDLRIMLPEHATTAPLEVIRYREEPQPSPARWIK